MKALSPLSRIFIGALVWTISFSAIGWYSLDRAMAENPNVVQTISENINTQIKLHLDEGAGSFVQAKDKWIVKSPKQEITMSGVATSFKVVSTEGLEVVIEASGQLNNKKSPRLLEVSSQGSSLTISEPESDAVRGLEVKVFIPKSYKGEVSVETVSGDVKLTQTQAEAIEIATVSGDIKGQEMAIEKIKAETVSGDLKWSSRIKANYELSSTSGDVEVGLPAIQGKTRFELDTISGKIDNRFSGLSGEGLHQVSVETVSGDIKIQ